MKKLLFILVIVSLSITSALAQGQKAPRVNITDETVIRDSSGTQLPPSVWRALLSTGRYDLKPTKPGFTDTEFTLLRLSDEAIKRRFDNIPRPRESPFFTTGKKPQTFSANDIDGNKYKLKELEGKVVVLNFWFINCGPCRMEIPELNKLADDYKDSSNIVFLAVALDPIREVAEFVKKMPFRYNIISDGRYISSIYRITSYPTNAIIDKTGKVIFHTTGYGAATIPWLRKTIVQALL